MTLLFSSDDVDFEKWMKDSAPVTKVHDVDAWSDELGAIVAGGNKLTGDLLPWSKTHELLAFRGGEVTIWAGPNGSGKSLLTSFIQLAFAKMGAKSCVGSFEMQPVQTLYRKLRMAAHGSKPTMQQKDGFISWLKGKLYMYDHVGSVEQEQLFAVVRYAAKELGVAHFWIDNLMMCVAGEDDYNAQKDFIAKSVALAIELDIHIHIVHHVRKLEDESKRITKYDIKGSGAITDLVPQVMIVNRNRSKEKKARDLELQGLPITPELLDTPDVFLSCEKQRNGTGWEGNIALWFDTPSQQYRGAAAHRMYDFI